jgi:serine/threonine protein kinase
MENVFIVSPEFGGNLSKRGFYWRKLWKMRWVVLHGTEIAYMDKKPENMNLKDLNVSSAQITPKTRIDSEDLDDDPNGFALIINDFLPGTQEPKTPTWYLRANTLEEKRQWLERLSRVHAIVCWLDEFEKLRVLGTGGSGIVYELKNKENGRRYALKEMDMQNSAQVARAVEEVEVLMNITRTISHPHIMRIERVFQVGDKFHMVFPLCTGGELYEAIIKRKHFTEFDAACIMRDLISALATLHDNNILHLDIKPENILFSSDAPDAKILLTDFGLAKVLNDSSEDEERAESTATAAASAGAPISTPKLKRESNPTVEEMKRRLDAFLNVGVLNKSLKGTIGYMSPELILTGVNTKAVDIWASGVVLFILLCGTPPFNSRSNRETLERSAKGEYKLTGPEWDSISEDAKDLVSRMLCYDPSKRITAREILRHPWIAMVVEDEEGEANTGIPLRSPLDDENNHEASVNTMLPTVDSVQTEAGDEIAASLPTRQPTMTRRQSATSTVLNSALRKLTTHVQERKLEKMASNITRLMSTMQIPANKKQGTLNNRAATGGAGGGARKFPIVNALKDRVRRRMGVNLSDVTSAGGVSGDSSVLQEEEDITAAVAESMTSTISTEVRDLIVKFFFNTLQPQDSSSSAATPSGEIGKLTVEQFGHILSEVLEVTGAPIVMITRFIDSDNDGFISVGDIILAETKMVQRSPDFLRVFFWLYTDAVWYPGRNINHLNMGFTANTSTLSNNLAKGTTVLKNMFTGDAPLQQFEAPKFITGEREREEIETTLISSRSQCECRVREVGV